MSFKNIDINKITIRKYKNSYLLSNPITIKTPKMYIPFGVEKYYNNYLLKIQFRNIKENEELKDLEDFFLKLEKKFSELIKDNIPSSISYSEKYDPLLTIKLPQQSNKFTCNAYKGTDPLSIFNIEKGNYCNCELLIDSIWYFKDKY